MCRNCGEWIDEEWNGEEALPALAVVYVLEGWWHPNVKNGQVHKHPERPGRGWSAASHRLCETVYTKRPR